MNQSNSFINEQSESFPINKEGRMIKTTSSSSQQHFSCDLVEQSKKHVAFLQTLHLHSITIHKPSNDTFRRYSELWLPLVYQHVINNTSNTDQSNSSEGLIPPADIAWFWHCHRLAPYRYAKHVQSVFFSSKKNNNDMKNSSSSEQKEEATSSTDKDLVVLDPEHPFVVQFEDNKDNLTFDAIQHSSAAEYTMRLWKQLYPSEPFFASIASTANDDEKMDYSNHLLSGFDVIESCQRQATFLWQVSQVNFQDDSFLQEGVENYFKFMSLMKRDKDKPRFLVPTYQIDLMWHTHMLSSIKDYHRDCLNLIQT